MKYLVFLLLIALAFSRSYPMFKQCDGAWGSNQIGTSPQSICQVGCLMSSAAMALAGTGHNYNPGTLNTWLKANGGYVNGNWFVWASINKLGLTFRGFVNNDRIKPNLDVGNVVILNVHNGGHYVLAHSYNGDTIYVNDPGYNTASYTLNTIVNGHTGIYTPSSLPSFLDKWILQCTGTINEIFGIKE